MTDFPNFFRRALCLIALVSIVAPTAASAEDRFGGPTYSGAPALAVTAALVQAGGGPKVFSISRALVAMVGQPVVDQEITKLETEYGKKAVQQWIDGFNLAAQHARHITREANGASVVSAGFDICRT